MDDSPFIKLLTGIREQYLTHYRASIEQRKRATSSWFSTSTEGIYPELLMKVGDGTNPQGSRFNLPLRVDIAARDPKGQLQVYTVETHKLPAFETIVAEFPSYKVQMQPFVWHKCDFLFEGDTTEWNPVLQWFQKWIDIHKARQPDEHGLCGVIHRMTEPSRTTYGPLFTVDFGSAPTKSFIQLVNQMSRMGLSKIRVGSFGI